jgi:RimJ/RimL family protein N-acetyltransferase
MSGRETEDPPYVSDSETDILLRPAMPEDRFRIRRWLAEPEIAAWWGNAASAEAEIALAMASDTAVCRIVLFGEEPIGYAHAVDVGLWGGERLQEIEPGTWDVDLFIGSEQHRSRGLGGVALARLVEEVFATTLAVACCGLVPIRNEAAVRAYERAGFVWRRIWNDPLLGPCWLMAKDRPSRLPDR